MLGLKWGSYELSRWVRATTYNVCDDGSFLSSNLGVRMGDARRGRYAAVHVGLLG